jgi:hypothetical protein
MTAAEERPNADRALSAQVWWELRHGRLRLALAENELAWAQQALVAGFINPDSALEVLDEAMAEIVGDAS